MLLKLIFFRTEQCEQCDRQGAIWDHVKREAPGNVEFREVLMDGEPAAVQHYGVRMHPCIVLEKEGHEVKRWTGVTSKLEIISTLKESADQAGERAASVEVPSGPAVPGGAVPGKRAEPPSRHVPPPPGGGPMPEPGPPGRGP